ncbi:MAG: hypothetical protein ACPGQD_00985 [Planctomycetota bacterium]
MGESFGSIFGFGAPAAPTIAAPAVTPTAALGPGAGGSTGGPISIFEILSPIAKAFGSFQSYNQQAGLLEANARLQELQARDERVAAGRDAAKQSRDRRFRYARNLAIARQTVGGAGGSLADTALQTAAYDELDALNTLYTGNRRADLIQSQAEITRYEARQVRSAGKQSLWGAASALPLIAQGIGGRGFSFNPLSVNA